MVNSEHLKFIGWLINRLIYKHLYSQDDIVIKNLIELKQELSKDYECNIDQEPLDIILSNYYIDFNLDKTEDFKIGFTDKDREQLRVFIRQIVNDVVNKKIDARPIMKG